MCLLVCFPHPAVSILRLLMSPATSAPSLSCSSAAAATTQYPQNLKKSHEKASEGGVGTITKIKDGDIKARKWEQDTPVPP